MLYKGYSIVRVTEDAPYKFWRWKPGRDGSCRYSQDHAYRIIRPDGTEFLPLYPSLRGARDNVNMDIEDRRAADDR